MEKKKSFWKKPLGILISFIGILAGLATIYGVYNEWFKPNPIEQVAVKIEKNQRRMSELKSVTIPDSLCDEAITEMKNCQQRILAYSKLMYLDFNSNDSTMRILRNLVVMLNVSTYMKGDFNDTMKKIISFGMDLDEYPYWGAIAEDIQKSIRNSEKCQRTLSNLIDQAKGNTNVAISDWVASDEFKEYLDYESYLSINLYEYLNVLQLEWTYHFTEHVKNDLGMYDYTDMLQRTY